MSSIGEILQEARNKKGVSQEEAAKVLKIKVERLRDLEENRYDQFPAYVYARSFLRLYADYLEIEKDALLQRFAEENPPPDTNAAFEIVESQLACSPIQNHSPKQTSFYLTLTGRTVLITAFIILVLISSFLWWTIYRWHRDSSSSRKPPIIQNETEIPAADSSKEWQGTTPALPITTPSLTLSTTNPPPETRRAP